MPPIISLPNYERVFRTIHGVLLNEKGNPAKACIYFAVIGAMILRTHHKLNASCKAGAAIYEFSSENNGLAFADYHANELSSSKTAFHCWVEVDNWIIDFQAPLFNEALREKDIILNLPRKMFQQNTQSESKSVNFNHKPNLALTSEVLENFSSKPVNNDILQICIEWYKPYPKKMHDAISIGDTKGNVNKVTLSPHTLVGAW